MNDITALAQRMKASALKAKSEANEWGYDTDAFHDEATPDAVIQVVEALEKAQKLATQQGNIACALFDEVTAQRQRIAELEGAEQKLCAANVTLDARAELAERQLADMESRTVTVKLPELCVGVVQGGHAVMVPYAAGHWFNKTAILEMLAAAGIQVIEGEQKNG
ncbi:hypothetical protein [Kluyvera ascorbata]